MYTELTINKVPFQRAYHSRTGCRLSTKDAYPKLPKHSVARVEI